MVLVLSGMEASVHLNYMALSRTNAWVNKVTQESVKHLYMYMPSSESKALYWCVLALPPLALLFPSQELTEEGLPLLLLFYPPDDADVKDLFKERVEAELLDQKGEQPI